MADQRPPPTERDRKGDQRFVRYDPATDQRFSTTLAIAIADRAGVHPTDLTPLGYVTNPEEIDALVADYPAGDGDVEGDLRFAFEGFDVTVHPSGLAELDPRDGEGHA